jgi:hypothetical protein
MLYKSKTLSSPKKFPPKKKLRKIEAFKVVEVTCMLEKFLKTNTTNKKIENYKK